MREQGIAANATSRAARGQTKRAERDAAYRAKARRRSSYALRDELQSIARELSATGTIRDAKRGRLLETRRTLLAGWNALAERLEAQGEVALGGDVRYFAKHLPPVMTDRERLASELVRIAQAQPSARAPKDERTHDPPLERTR